MSPRLQLALVLVALGAACRTRPATEADCAAIVDRIVTLELLEQGFRDEIVQERERRRMRRELRGEIQACVGRPVSPDTLSCVASATSTEALSHRCFE